MRIDKALLFGRVLDGLPNQPKWGLNEKLVMVGKLGYGRINGLATVI
jgi:hypothetical protein